MKRLASASGIAGFAMLWILAVIVIVLLNQVQNYFGRNILVRERIGVREAFEGGAGSGGEVAAAAPRLEEAGAGQQPAGASLERPNDAYALLKGWLPEAAMEAGRPKLTAQSCYETDFQARLERTGNYRQLTNNYKRGTPDSCSAPLTEMVLGVYQPDPVPYVGCMQ
jgi:hypothetical protein